MVSRTKRMAMGVALLIAISMPLTGRADGQKALEQAVVHFGQPLPQTGGAVSNVLFPDEVTIRKNGTVTFVVNGGGHGIAIHAVSKNTTRDDIAEDLCQGGANDADRAGRAAVCNGTVVTIALINGVQVSVVGTQNLDYPITDGKGDLVIEPGFNVNIPASGIVITNPRVDDTEHSQRLLATSGRVRVCGPGESEPVCDSTLPGANPAGAFLAGSAPTATPGNRIQVQFTQTGRYLVICMNRGHLLNDHMFGFVNVVGEGNEGK